MTSTNSIPTLVTVDIPSPQTVTYSDGAPVAIDFAAPKQVSVQVYETGPKGDKGDKGADGAQGIDGRDGITHAVTTINTDSSRPIAYWGYVLVSDNSQHIARLDYTSSQQPTVTRAAVTSVAASWAGRSSLTYL